MYYNKFVCLKEKCFLKWCFRLGSVNQINTWTQLLILRAKKLNNFLILCSIHFIQYYIFHDQFFYSILFSHSFYILFFIVFSILLSILFSFSILFLLQPLSYSLFYFLFYPLFYSIFYSLFQSIFCTLFCSYSLFSSFCLSNYHIF